MSFEDMAKVGPGLIYVKFLGWHEFDVTGDKHDAMVVCMFALYGYNVFRLGSYTEHIGWFEMRDEALEFAVDRARQDIAHNEFSNYSE